MGSVDDGALGNQHKMLIAFNHGVKVRNRIKHGDVTAIGQVNGEVGIFRGDIGNVVFVCINSSTVAAQFNCGSTV